MSPLKAAKTAFLLVWTLALLPAQVAGLVLWRPLARGVPVVYHRVVARVLRVRIDVRGTPAPGTTLFVANHSSWLDIVVLSAVAPVSFVAKSEIARWPGVRILAWLQRSVFVERRRAQTGRNRTAIGARLAAGDNIVLFAEGTAGDGNRVLPFRSALFAAAETLADERDPWVQPVTVAYTHLDGLPLGRRGRPLMAWYGSMSLPAHFWTLLGHRDGRARVTLHEPVRPSVFASRKELAAHCHRVVAREHGRVLAGCSAAAPAGPRLRPAVPVS